jgi:hypothetical protein
MALNDYQAPLTAGNGGLLVKTKKDSVTGDLYQVIMLADANGNVIGSGGDPGNLGMNVNLSTTIAGEDQTNNRINTIVQSAPYNITTATNTVVKSGSGRIVSITCNTLVANATAVLYDNVGASGIKIATITLPSTVTSSTPFSLEINGGGFLNGLTVSTTGTADWTFWVA